MKEYVAVVEKRFPSSLGTWVTWRDRVRWDDALSSCCRGGSGGTSMDMLRGKQNEGSDGLPAETVARVTKRAGEVSLVELQPRTGRRHQLRVQLASRGCPIVGDRMYGSRLPLKSEGNV